MASTDNKEVFNVFSILAVILVTASVFLISFAVYSEPVDALCWGIFCSSASSCVSSLCNTCDFCTAPTTTCTPSWQCTDFSACSATCGGGTQARTCNDLNNCGTTSGKPTESQSCNTQSCPTTSSCTDECVFGSWRCSTSNQQQECRDFNNDGCTEWGDRTYCPSFAGDYCTTNTRFNADCLSSDPSCRSLHYTSTCSSSTGDCSYTSELCRYGCTSGRCNPPPCSPNWQCPDWSTISCPSSGTKTRTCTDLNNCGTTSGKPAESQSCTPVTSTSSKLISISFEFSGPIAADGCKEIQSGGSTSGSGTLIYRPGFPSGLPAMGMGTLGSGVFSSKGIGYISPSSPFKCSASGGERSIGCSNIVEGKICECIFDNTNTEEATGTASYTITADADAASGRYDFGLASNDGSEFIEDNFCIRIVSPLPSCPNAGTGSPQYAGCRSTQPQNSQDKSATYSCTSGTCYQCNSGYNWDAATSACKPICGTEANNCCSDNLCDAGLWCTGEIKCCPVGRVWDSKLNNGAGGCGTHTLCSPTTPTSNIGQPACTFTTQVCCPAITQTGPNTFESACVAQNDYIVVY